VQSRKASRWRESGTESRHSRTKPLTDDVSSVVGGATATSSAAGCPSVATTQVITGQATTKPMKWGAHKSRDHSAVTRWRSAPIATEVILYSAAVAWR